MITNIHEIYKTAKEYQERLQARAREALLRAVPFVDTPEHREDVVTFLMGGGRKSWSAASLRGLNFDMLVHNVMFDMTYVSFNVKTISEFERSITILESLINNDPRNP